MTSERFVHDGEIVVPPLKWAGGKRWLVRHLLQLMPNHYCRYFEPFVGGGAAFFSLAPKQAVLADTNEDLIATYKAIRQNWKRVWHHLRDHALQHTDDYYYQIRRQKATKQYEAAARMLYLNRTCWNGLYRVNRDGAFNVPRGTKDDVLLSTDNPRLISNLLRNAELVCSDFELVIEMAGRGDLIYADPPYTVRHNFNGFLKYNESIFTWADQERLADSLRRARDRGAFIIVSNANHASVRQLYRPDFDIRTVFRTSKISGSADFRGRTSELLIIGSPTR